MTDAVEQSGPWPALVLDEWQETYATVHRWCQIVGKTCLALAPFQNHWWHCAFQVTARGLRTPVLFHDDRSLELEFNFIDHNLYARASDGTTRSMPLLPGTVADFFAEYQRILNSMGFRHRSWPVPNEIPDAVPFAEDVEHASYDARAMQSCWHILVQADRALKRFRSRFTGKCSPSHFWWGAFDLSCTRFSGRRAPMHPGGVPNLPDRVTREGYSHECISAGWWPGSIGGPISEPAFYAYVYPEPAGCPQAVVQPVEAHYDLTLHEWILPYEAVRNAANPDAVLLDFLQSTYEAAANLAGWNRSELEAPR
jgi:hypothetical protein